AQLLAVHLDMELTVGDRFHRVVCLDRLVRAPVPDDNLAPAAFTARDPAFEVEVLDRMILDVHAESFHRWVERRTLRDRPTYEHAIHLEPEVVVQAPRAMTLHDEAGLIAVAGRCGRTGRLGCLREVALRVVLGEPA